MKIGIIKVLATGTTRWVACDATYNLRNRKFKLSVDNEHSPDLHRVSDVEADSLQEAEVKMGKALSELVTVAKRTEKVVWFRLECTLDRAYPGSDELREAGVNVLCTLPKALTMSASVGTTLRCRVLYLTTYEGTGSAMYSEDEDGKKPVNLIGGKALPYSVELEQYFKRATDRLRELTLRSIEQLSKDGFWEEIEINSQEDLVRCLS